MVHVNMHTEQYAVAYSERGIVFSMVMVRTGLRKFSPVVGIAL